MMVLTSPIKLELRKVLFVGLLAALSPFSEINGTYQLVTISNLYHNQLYLLGPVTKLFSEQLDCSRKMRVYFLFHDSVSCQRLANFYCFDHV